MIVPLPMGVKKFCLFVVTQIGGGTGELSGLIGETP